MIQKISDYLFMSSTSRLLTENTRDAMDQNYEHQLVGSSIRSIIFHKVVVVEAQGPKKLEIKS